MKGKQAQKASNCFETLILSLGRTPSNTVRPVVCVQGLGFVGMAMAIAVAQARQEDKTPAFNVVGVDLPSEDGLAKVAAMNEGRLSVRSLDEHLPLALRKSIDDGNLAATTDAAIFSAADIVVVDVPLDLESQKSDSAFRWEPFRQAIRTLGERMKIGSLLIVESTVPPGSCERVVVPEMEAALQDRGLPPESILIAHSFERVMPGKDYLHSITHYWRVFAGYTPQAGDLCEDFLKKIVNTAEYPLTRLSSVTASETAKVLENSYRAVNIAFMEEWGRFAEMVGIDLYEVIDAIRKRPTHSNIRQPGFGVGGYCLTKDPLFTSLSADELHHLSALKFPFCEMAVKTNREMPLVSLNYLEKMSGGSLQGKKILLLGVSYREDIADTRCSPSRIFVQKARERGAQVFCHDPLVDYWQEMSLALSRELPSPKGMDAVVFAVGHAPYRNLEIKKWLEGSTPVVLDANRVLSLTQLKSFQEAGCRVFSIGRGGKL